MCAENKCTENDTESCQLFIKVSRSITFLQQLCCMVISLMSKTQGIKLGHRKWHLHNFYQIVLHNYIIYTV